MINPFHEINWAPEEEDIRKFGTTVLIGFVIIVFLFLIFSSCETIILPLLLLLIGSVIFSVSMSFPKGALPFYYVWFFVSACIGIVISNLLLLAFFYLVFTPFAFILKTVTGRDPLKLEKEISKNTYWIDKKEQTDLKRYLKQY